MDITQLLTGPMKAKIQAYAESIGLSQEALLMAMDVAQFTHDNDRFFVDELEKLIAEKDKEIELLKNQIKP